MTPTALKVSPVIIEAMKALGSHPEVPLEAPQAILYAQPTTTLSATAHVFGGSALPTYQVNIWHTHRPLPVNSPRIASPNSRRLAAYSGTSYASEGIAAVREGLKIMSGYSVAPGPATIVSIAPGITGKESRSSASANSLPATSLRWASGPWQVVSNAPSPTSATQQARQVTDDLTSVSLPEPTTGGYLVVNSTASVTAQGRPRIATEVVITWIRGATVYQVTTFSGMQHPIEAALSIAHSMRPYKP